MSPITHPRKEKVVPTGTAFFFSFSAIMGREDLKCNMPLGVKEMLYQMLKNTAFYNIIELRSVIRGEMFVLEGI